MSEKSEQKTSETTGIEEKYQRVLDLQKDPGLPVAKGCRKVGLSRNTFYYLKRQKAGAAK